MPAARRPPPPTYTHEQKVALVTEIERRVLAGRGSLRAIAAELGTCDASYNNWIRAGIKAPVPTMRPVEVTALVPVGPSALTLVPPAKAAPAQLTLVAPGGYRLEGLCVETAAALLRALS